MSSQDSAPSPSDPAVLLRRPRTADRDALAGLWRDPRVMEFLGGVRDEDFALREVDVFLDHWKEHGIGMYVVEVDGFENPVGVCGLNVLVEERGRPVELSYAFHPSVWGRGIATRAGGMVLSQDAQRRGAGEIVAITQEGNHRSHRVLERLGFTHQRSLIRWDSPQRWYVLSLRDRESR